MNKSGEYYEIDLLQLLRLLWRKAWIIALTAAVGGVAAFCIAAFAITPKYEAQAMLYVNNSDISVGSAKLSISSTDLSAAQSLVDTYIVILNSRATLNEVINEAGLDMSYNTLKSMLSASSVNSTEIFSVTITDTDPREAELIANTIVDVLPDRIADIVDGSSVRVVDYAVVPSVKSSPNITRFTAIGLLLGLVAACAAITVSMLLDTLIHNEDYLMNTYDLPVLAVIPDLEERSDNSYYSAYSYSAHTSSSRSSRTRTLSTARIAGKPVAKSTTKPAEKSEAKPAAKTSTRARTDGKASSGAAAKPVKDTSEDVVTKPENGKRG